MHAFMIVNTFEVKISFTYREDNNNFISLEPSFETSGSNDQVRVDYT